MYSEETIKLNKALTYCYQLKTELNDAIGYIRKLSKKYDQIDYMEGFREFDKSYSNLSPKTVTPIKKVIRKKSTLAVTATSTPKLSAKARIALDFPMINKKSSSSSSTSTNGKRQPQEIKRNNNKIIVRMLKVQRNIESIMNKMKVLQKNQQKNHAIALEQSLYQTCNNSSCCSPGKLGHSQCSIDHLTFSDNSFGGQNHNNSGSYYRAAAKENVYLTPLRQLQKRAIIIHSRLSTLRSHH